MNQIHTALEMYFSDNSHYPSTVTAASGALFAIPLIQTLGQMSPLLLRD